VAGQSAGLAVVVLWLDDRCGLVASKKAPRKGLLATISEMGLAWVRKRGLWWMSRAAVGR